MLDKLKLKYPRVIAWSFGDKLEMAYKLAELVIKGIKTAGCCLLSYCNSEPESLTIGGYSIILNSKEEPVCVIRHTLLRIN